MKQTSCDIGVINHVIDEAVIRIACNPPNYLSNETYQVTVKDGWHDQRFNWSDFVGDPDGDEYPGGENPGWGDVVE